MYTSIEGILRASSILACAVVLGMLGIFIATGVGQDPLQFIHSSAEYGRLLLGGPTALWRD